MRSAWYCCAWGLLLLVLTVNCSRRSYTEVATVRVKLIDEIESYQSPDELKRKLAAGLLPWTIVEDSKLAASDRRPPFHQYSVVVKGYQHLGLSGSLEARFLNSRLMEVRFFPDDFDRYLLALSASLGKPVESGQESLVRPNTRLWIAAGFEGRRFVGYGDTRLQEEQNDWIRRYA
jgi:hypothetical protein